MEKILNQILTELKDLKQGQLKLEQGQQKLEQRQQKLEQGQLKLEQGQLNLTDRMESFERQVNSRFAQVDKKLDMLVDTIADIKEDITANSLYIKLVDNKIKAVK